MDPHDHEDAPAKKRRKLDDVDVEDDSCSDSSPPNALLREEVEHEALRRPISPPALRKRNPQLCDVQQTHGTTQEDDAAHKSTDVVEAKERSMGNGCGDHGGQPNQKQIPLKTTLLPSPIHLTRIRDLAPQQNVDTLGLEDILGDPMIKECWNFNYLFDVDFVLRQFDADIRDLVRVKIVHGFWKSENPRRIAMLEAAERYPNVNLISAFMPDPFGTHHTKMMILIRHDDLAQVVIHTANMISRDWTNMTQAVWRSPLLPLRSEAGSQLISNDESEVQTHAIGTGERFKVDLLRYLKAYGKRLTTLAEELIKYDFKSVRAAFLGSTPSRQKFRDAKPDMRTSWGWRGLQEILSALPKPTEVDTKARPHIVMQMSSIATLGQNPTWMDHFRSVLANNDRGTSSLSFTKSASLVPSSKKIQPAPKSSIIFPTANEIRISLDGYNSGDSIHTRIDTVNHQKQLEHLRPMLCHWRHTEDNTQDAQERRRAERGPAAPHIKTYIRFTDESHKSIDWALVTSANLSKQAWGELENKDHEVRVQSYECGVVVWPALFAESSDSNDCKNDVKMVPVFGKDTPEIDESSTVRAEGDEQVGEGKTPKRKTVIGFRMPYDVPLEPYGPDEIPWCARMRYDEPDWKGRTWEGYSQG